MASLVTASDLEESLARLEREIDEPRAGLYGPNSMVWRVAREAAVFLGAGRAALLQLAHPFVGTAVPHQAKTRADPVARFQGTFRSVFRMVFGDLAEATREARKVFAIHCRVHGTLPEDAGPFRRGDRFDARDRDAQVWVLATLWDTSIRVYERVVRPLSKEERERYYAESRRFAMLFGVEADLPPSFVDLQRYAADMMESDVLTPTSDARALGRFLMRPGNAGARWVTDAYGVVTAQLLSPRLADAFGLDRGGPDGETRAARVLDLVALAVPLLPPRVRFLPAYIEAKRRVAGRAERDRVGELLGRVYVGRGRSVPPPR